MQPNDPSVVVAGAGLLFVFWILAAIVAVVWTFLPFYLLSRLKRIHLAIEAGNRTLQTIAQHSNPKQMDTWAQAIYEKLP